MKQESIVLPLLLLGSTLCAELLITTYGAVGNDQIDDTAAFTAAFAAADTGDTVRVPAGTFLISGEIQIKKNRVHFKGVGDASIIKAKTKVNMLSIQCSDSEFAYFTLDGNDVSKNGIGVSSSHNITIHHLNIRNLPSYTDVFGPMGIYMSSNVSGSYIYSNTFYNIGTNASYGGAIRMSYGSHRNVIEFNSIDRTGRGGIFCNNDANYNIIRRNTIRGSGLKEQGLGIEAWGNCNYTIVEHNDVDHWISIDASHFCAVRYNNVSDSTRELAPGLEAVAVTYGVLTDNLVKQGQAVGLSISNVKPKEFTFFAYNLFNNSYLWGSQLQGETGGIYSHYLYRNVFSNTQSNSTKSPYPTNDGHGFRINGNTFWTVLEENQIIYNGGHGIQGGGDFNEYINNTITFNGGSAYSGLTGTQFLWENNVVHDNQDNTVPATKPFTNQRPRSLFTYSIDGLQVTFNDQSTDPDGSITHRLWDFNSGSPTDQESPIYTYTSPGTYRVTLLVWDNEGRGGRSEQMVLVGVATPTDSAFPINIPFGPPSPNHPELQRTSCAGALPFTVLLPPALILNIF